MTGPRQLKPGPWLARAVVRLRAEGVSFNEIGRLLGISHPFAKKTFEKSVRPVKNESQPGGFASDSKL